MNGMPITPDKNMAVLADVMQLKGSGTSYVRASSENTETSHP
jgi:hypothetical protein